MLDYLAFTNGVQTQLGSSEESSVPLQAIGASERVMYYLDKPVAAQIQGGDCVPSWSGKVSTNPCVPLCSLPTVALPPGWQMRSAAHAAAWFPLALLCLGTAYILAICSAHTTARPSCSNTGKQLATCMQVDFKDVCFRWARQLKRLLLPLVADPERVQLCTTVTVLLPCGGFQASITLPPVP